jgi:hypothetical protein
MRNVILFLMFIPLTGCTWQKMSQGVYEGVRVRDQLGSTPAERVGKPEMPADYQQYDTMRNEKRPYL